MARRTVTLLRGRVGCFKVGLQLFTAAGPAVVRDIVEAGEKVFLDLKFHDIPNTVARAVEEAARAGAFFTDVHTTGGEEMMRAAAAAARAGTAPGAARPRILGVTILTSLDAAAMGAVGLRADVPALVTDLAILARRSGLDGVVASAHEVASIRRECGPSFVIVVPGIRPGGAGLDDQKRAATPREAILAGADYLVVGRPITGGADPAGAAEAIAAEMAM
ncbi:MAG: orotidine-5'-phosphate decarboxylase [Acidobacteria bacterium]|nr:orotidine-5'-phosphate decarboxylase [Acidobacteriota bacterium]